MFYIHNYEQPKKRVYKYVNVLLKDESFFTLNFSCYVTIFTDNTLELSLNVILGREIKFITL